MNGLRRFSFSVLNQGQSLNLGTGAVTLGGTRTVTVGANTLTVGGVIGGSGYGLIKAGGGTLVLNGAISTGTGSVTLNAGALTLNGANTCSGATTVSGGTLQLSGASGSITNSAVTTTGGALTLWNANAANNGNRVSDSAAFTMIGGTFNFNNDASANDFSESVGTLTLAGGVNTVAIGEAAVGRTSTLTFASLSRTTGIINFSVAAPGTLDPRGRITFTTPPALVNGIIGPWATVNGTAYATLDANSNVVAYAGGTLTNVTRLSSGSKIIPDSSTSDVVIIEGTGTATNLTLEAATTTINSLMQSISGGTSAATVTIGASETLQVGAITIVSGAGALTLGTAANSGTLKPATAGGALLLINNGNTMTINSVIADNTSASSITKEGSGALVLAANNTYTGGTVISGGTLIISANASLGALTAPLTLNANATLPNSINYGTRPVVLNNGAIFYGLGIGSFTIGGTISGDGGFQVSNSGPQGSSGKVYLTNTGNTFTGPLVLSGGNYNPAFTVASIGDAPGAGQIQFAGGNSADFIVSGGSSPIVLNYRQFKLAYDWHTPTISNNNGSDANTLTVNTDLIVTATANLVFVLGGSNTGMNTFAGRIANGPVSVISLTKADAGTWILLGTNTYSGVTTISAGKLSINSLANVNGGASALGNPSSVANGTLSLNGVTLQYTGSGHTSDRVVNLSGTTAGAVLDASGTGPLVLTSALTATGAGIKTLTLAGSSTATNTLAGAIVDNGGANKTSLIKTNAGTWVLAGSNTYTGTTTLRGGTLTGVTGGSCLGSSLTVTNTPGVTSALGVTVNDNTKQWSCANLAFTTNGLGSQLKFSFAVAPSTSLAPLSVTNSLTFTGAPVVVVNTENVPVGNYPLLVVGGASAPTVVPALELMNAATKGGSLAWGGTGNKTLYLTVSSKATVILFR